jgi:putative flippase GtrA
MNKIKLLLSIQFVKYGFVGVVGTVAHTGTLWLLTEQAGVNPLLSSTCGFCISLIISYYLNSVLTFKRGFHIKVFLKYFFVSFTGLLLNLVILFMVQHVLHLNYMIGQLIAIVLVPILNYTLNKYWAFNSGGNTGKIT